MHVPVCLYMCVCEDAPLKGVCVSLHECADLSWCYHQGFIRCLIPVLSEGRSEAGVKDERCEEALQPAQTPPAFPRTTSAAEPTDQIAASALTVTAFTRHP